MLIQLPFGSWGGFLGRRLDVQFPVVFNLVGEKAVPGYLEFGFALQPDNHMAGTAAGVELGFFDAESACDECLTDEFLGEVDVVDQKSLYLGHCT